MLVGKRLSNSVCCLNLDANRRQGSSIVSSGSQTLKTHSVVDVARSSPFHVFRSRQPCDLILQELIRPKRTFLLHRIHSVTSIVCSSSNSAMKMSTLEDVFCSNAGKTKKAVLLDQFGVLHDGQKAYPGAVEAVEYLHGLGLRLLIVSNSSRSTFA